jgi:hypothetical protein
MHTYSVAGAIAQRLMARDSRSVNDLELETARPINRSATLEVVAVGARSPGMFTEPVLRNGRRMAPLGDES